MPRLVVAQNREVVQDTTALAGQVVGDPVPVNGFECANVMLIVHYLWAFGGGGPTEMVRYVAGVSNGRVNWTLLPGLTGSMTAPTGSTTRQVVVPVPPAFVRFRMNALRTGASLLGRTAVDVCVRLANA